MWKKKVSYDLLNLKELFVLYKVILHSGKPYDKGDEVMLEQQTGEDEI